MVLEENDFVVKQACKLYISWEKKFTLSAYQKTIKNVSFYLTQCISYFAIELPFPIPIVDVIPFWQLLP